MSFRKSRVYTQGLSTSSRGQNRQIGNYQSARTGIRRHEYEIAAPDIGSHISLVVNDYWITTLAQFERSFDATADGLPTATDGNNFQTKLVMNGSRIGNMNSTIRLKNKSSSQPATLTVYEIALSWYDANTFDTLDGTNSPFSLATAAVGAQGDVTLKTTNITRFTENIVKQSMFREHFLRKIGSITLGNTDQASSTADLTIRQIPRKCRKSQTGMYFGYAFVNDSAKNGGLILDFEYSLENNFDEFPSDNRVPWLA